MYNALSNGFFFTLGAMAAVFAVWLVLSTIVNTVEWAVPRVVRWWKRSQLRKWWRDGRIVSPL